MPRSRTLTVKALVPTVAACTLLTVPLAAATPAASLPLRPTQGAATLPAVSGVLKPAHPEPTRGQPNTARPRVILSTDFPPPDGIPGGEVGPATKKSDLDDLQTMVRFLSYANDFEVVGLVASSGTFANYADKKGILTYIDRYAEVYPQLKANDRRYPSPDSLRAVTSQGLDGTWGQPAEKILGAGKDTEASNKIIRAVDQASTSSPVWFLTGGGPRELAQALWKVKTTRSPARLATFVSHLRLYLIDDQDGTAAWIRDTFPQLFVITNKCYWGMANTSTYDGDWLRNNVTMGHGTLGMMYPLSHWTYPDQGVYEGDSPTFLYLLSGVYGLSNPEDPTMGGWGGRFVATAPNRYECAPEGAQSISRWEEARNADFAQRMQLQSTGAAQVNHRPTVTLNGDRTTRIVTISARAGTTVELTAAGTADPDGQTLSYSWSGYPSSDLSLGAAGEPTTTLTVPNSPGQRVTVVLAVTDSGTPALTSYRRLLIDIT